MAFAATVRSVKIEHHGTRFELVSDTHFGAPLQDVFDTLIDYDQLSAISKTIKESRYLDGTVDGQPLVYTRIGACLMFFCKTIEKVERLEFEVPCYIAATAIAERSTVHYSRSEWSLYADSDGTTVIYRLEFEPGFWVPPLVGPIVIKRMLLKRGAAAVEAIEAMALRRAAARTLTTAY